MAVADAYKTETELRKIMKAHNELALKVTMLERRIKLLEKGQEASKAD